MTPRRLPSCAVAALLAAVMVAGEDAAKPPEAEQAQAEQPQAEQPQAEQPQAEQPQAEKPQAAKPKAKKKTPAKGKKKAPPAESRYKSRELTESVEHSYRFDAHGNPIGIEKPKSSAPAKEKPEEKPGVCSPLAPCPEKGADSDAL